MDLNCGKLGNLSLATLANLKIKKYKNNFAHTLSSFALKT